MKLFIYEANWSDCAGAVIAMAISREEAERLILEQNPFGETHTYRFLYDDKKEPDVFDLSFIGEFEIGLQGPPRVILNSWHWA